MSIAPFHLTSITSSYGTSGQETVAKMTDRLSQYSLSMTYDENGQKFVIQNSSNMKYEQIVKIFSGVVYEGWRPKVLEETDELGNRQVQLECMVPRVCHAFQSNPTELSVEKTVSQNESESKKLFHQFGRVSRTERPSNDFDTSL